jgi:hypothetical protein
MITYKMALLPTIPFGLGQITNGLKAMISVGIFVFVFVMVCLLINNFIVEPLLKKQMLVGK